MKKTKSPSKKRQEHLNLFFDYCCETYKNKLEGNDELLQQVYNIIIAKMHGAGYMDLFYGNTKNNGIYIKALQDFCQNEPVNWGIRGWKIRQTSNEIIKLINEKL